MKKKNKPDQKTHERVPIIDGDARPDQQLEKDDLKRTRTTQQNKVSSNRAADKNTLENFRDGK
jgi:hypothetical protein